MARARKHRRDGKSASTQAGVFVRGEIERRDDGTHAERPATETIAIGLPDAQRAGVAAPDRNVTKPASRKRPVTKRKALKAAARQASTTVETPKRQRAASAPKAAHAKGAAAKKAAPARSGASRAAGATRAARMRAMHSRVRE
ncbi:ku family containing domain-containing protein [Dyella solisilvae]|uniref:Ku family containing domain-containing protein n=1 Tax=Dyella solisilvae TaxID=1920168 RepID=A0A370K6G9_9GAMM|nr:ku family containing domain-containing protein [Dyella solisilvae]RDI98241.1 ku family containing domain-containing protein [Dyella solisilvae]